MKKLFKVLSLLIIGIGITSLAFGAGIDSYSKLLLHGDGADTATFVPDSSNYNHYTSTTDKCVAMLHFNGADTATTTTEAQTNKAVTFVGTAQIDTAQSKFGGSSLLLDGNSDYVTLVDSADWNFGTGDFTMEAQIMRHADASAGFIIISQYDSSNTTRNFQLYITNSTFTFYYDASHYKEVSATFNVDTWYHIALVRSGNNLYFFQNGTQVGATQDVTGVTMGDGTGVLAIGANTYPSGYFNGWIDDVRILKGKALYTANFTAPTVEPSPKDVTCVGNAQIDTAQKVYGTGSILFDGTGDYLSLVDSEDFNVANGDFTLHARARFNAHTGGHVIMGSSIATKRAFMFYYYSSNLKFNYSVNGTDTSTADFSWTPTDNTWYDIELDRSGANLYCFVDGTQIGSTYNIGTSNIYNTDQLFFIGQEGGGSYFNGWLDEVLFVKGKALHTANFTPYPRAYDTATDYSGQAIVITQ